MRKLIHVHSVTKGKDRKSEIDLIKHKHVRPEKKVGIYAQDLLDCF